MPKEKNKRVFPAWLRQAPRTWPSGVTSVYLNFSCHWEIAWEDAILVAEVAGKEFTTHPPGPSQENGVIQLPVGTKLTSITQVLGDANTLHDTWWVTAEIEHPSEDGTTTKHRCKIIVNAWELLPMAAATSGIDEAPEPQSETGYHPGQPEYWQEKAVRYESTRAPEHMYGYLVTSLREFGTGRSLKDVLVDNWENIFSTVPVKVHCGCSSTSERGCISVDFRDAGELIAFCTNLATAYTMSKRNPRGGTP